MNKFINEGGSGEEEAKDVRRKRKDGAPGQTSDYGIYLGKTNKQANKQKNTFSEKGDTGKSRDFH